MPQSRVVQGWLGSDLGRHSGYVILRLHVVDRDRVRIPCLADRTR